MKVDKQIHISRIIFSLSVFLKVKKLPLQTMKFAIETNLVRYALFQQNCSTMFAKSILVKIPTNIKSWSGEY